MGPGEMARTIGAGTVYGAGVSLSVVSTLILLPVCLIPGIIGFLIALAAVCSGATSNGGEKRHEYAGLIDILAPFLVGGAVIYICLMPGLYPGRVGKRLANKINPKKVEQF